MVIHRSDAERENKSTACCFRKHHRKHGTEIKDTRKTRETCRMRRNSPVVSDQKSSSRCSKDQDVFSSTPERLPSDYYLHLWKCPQDAGVSRLCLHKLEVDFPSTFESHSLISDAVEPNLDSEFAYIYAESIKGCDSSCCTTPGDCNTHNPLVKTERHIFEEESEDSDWDLYMSAYSTAAAAGSRLNADRFGSLLDWLDLYLYRLGKERNRAGLQSNRSGVGLWEFMWLLLYHRQTTQQLRFRRLAFRGSRGNKLSRRMAWSVSARIWGRLQRHREWFRWTVGCSRDSNGPPAFLWIFLWND